MSRQPLTHRDVEYIFMNWADIKNGGTIVIQIQISRLAFIIYF